MRGKGCRMNDEPINSAGEYDHIPFLPGSPRSRAFLCALAWLIWAGGWLNEDRRAAGNRSVLRRGAAREVAHRHTAVEHHHELRRLLPHGHLLRMVPGKEGSNARPHRGYQIRVGTGRRQSDMNRHSPKTIIYEQAQHEDYQI